MSCLSKWYLIRGDSDKMIYEKYLETHLQVTKISMKFKILFVVQRKYFKIHKIEI